MKILIVDDLNVFHLLIKGLFQDYSEFEFLSAYNGKEALKLLSENGGVDVILLDWKMPEMDGPEALDEIRKLGLSTPVIMMTTKNSKEDIQQMLDAGVSEYIMKPFTFDILVARIQSVTGRSTFYAE